MQTLSVALHPLISIKPAQKAPYPFILFQGSCLDLNPALAHARTLIMARRKTHTIAEYFRAMIRVYTGICVRRG